MNKNKNFKWVLLLLCVTFFSCEKKETAEPASSITDNGIISGTIVNYSATAIDSIITYGYLNTSSIGKCKVSTEGKFTMSLPTPKLERIGSVPGLTISDTTALTAMQEGIYTNIHGFVTGEIMKCNYTTNTETNVGAAFSEFIYMDRPITIKGSENLTLKNDMFTINETLNYNVILKKGWNEIVTKIDASALNFAGGTITMSATNTRTDDLQWKFFQTASYSGVKQQAKGQSIIKTLRLFRK